MIIKTTSIPDPMISGFNAILLAGNAALNTHIITQRPARVISQRCFVINSSHPIPGIAAIIAGKNALTTITTTADTKITNNHKKLNTRVSKPLTRSGTSYTALNDLRIIASTELAAQIVVTIENDKIPTPPFRTDLIIGSKIDIILLGSCSESNVINSFALSPAKLATAPTLIKIGTIDNKA